MTETLHLISRIIFITLTILYLPQLFYVIFGLFIKPKKYKKADQFHHFGIIICAHNEENVIADILDSIEKQDYPKDKITTFVVADNCTDKTENNAKDKAIVISRKGEKNKGKSYALDYALNKILKNSEYNDIEAFLVFDADNILTKNYVSKMNDAFSSGKECATSFRNSKNYSQNWISATSSIFFLRECALVHKTRNAFNIGTYVSGTGFFVSRKIIEQNQGWKYNTMIEDIEFSINEAIKGNKIAYVDEAEFFDEQPVKFKDMVNQRMRWCKGAHQCNFRYNFKLIKKQVKNKNRLTLFELLIHVTPIPALVFSAWIVFSILFGIDAFALKNVSYNEGLINILKTTYNFIGIFLLMALLSGFVTLIKTYKRVPNSSIIKQLLYTFIFPFSAFLFVPISIVALFKKVKWKKIPHCSVKQLSTTTKQ